MNHEGLRPVLVLAGLAASALAAACGTYHPNRVGFRFTPVPYTVVSRGCDAAICSDVYSLSDDCDWYAADQVWLRIDEEKRAAFNTWADGFGFDRIYGGTPFVFQGTPQPTDVVVRVPAGSVRDAMTLIAKRPGVVSVGRNGSLWIPERVPDFIQQCERRLRQPTSSATP